VVERIATIAASEVPGVVPNGSVLTQLTSRSLPRADVRLAGRRARIEVSVAAAWPVPLGAVAADVRDRVAEQLSELASLTVDGVSVTVTSVVHVPEQPRRAQ
jgi:uncharacterized alkaline shock family protein YloU